jgi:eukaryotic-like serine/threonine-protein kinase
MTSGKESAGTDEPGGTGSPATDTPAQIGPYKILRPLGEGGMGVVYLAEQTGMVRRRVALKIIKLGMDTKQVVARFESERQALAVMDHPNIAKVYDGGATETGRPYFVMELVQGTPITEYADAHKLGTEQRVHLFVDICRAVQHAHHKGVIHRDLKPSNVLVTVLDSSPQVKVIDFGIAKAVSQGMTDRTLVTYIDQMVGTPEYMSPEQAEMSGIDVDTRTDIYSLGVMLYELLSGSLPFEFRSKNASMIPSLIRETEVPRPSTRLTGEASTQQAIAQQRGTTPDFLRRELKGDLDWIILKAMEKDRTRRYETANELAQELERHLNHQPVLASPPSVSYQLRKFVERNRAGVMAVAFAVLALVAGSTAATVGLIQARRSGQAARREAATAERVTEFLVNLFEVSDPGEARGNTVTAREILDRGATRIETELAGQPIVQARLMGTMGDVYRALGLYNEAKPLLEQAVDLAERIPAGGEAAMAERLRGLGTLYRQQGRFADAEPILQRSLLLHRQAWGDHDPKVARALRSLAAVYVEQGKSADAEPLLREALSILDEQPQADPTETAGVVNDLGGLYWGQQRYDEAQPYFERSLQLREQEFGPDHPLVASSVNNLGALYFTQGDYARAEKAYDRARVIWESTLEPGHPRLGNVYNNLAETYGKQGKYAEAEDYFRRALAIKEKTLVPDHPSLATSLTGLANVYRDEGRYGEAEPLYQRALSIREKALGAGSPGVVETRTDYARMLRSSGRAAEAAALEVRADSAGLTSTRR